MYKSLNSSDLSATWEEVETNIRPIMPKANQADSSISQEKDGDTSFQEDDEKWFFKGVLVALPISLALWCIIVSLAIVIF